VRSENFLLVSAAAQRFGHRPSQLVGLDDPVLALEFDLAAAARLVRAEREALAAAEVEASEQAKTSEMQW
jgi:hypothetical protein